MGCEFFTDDCLLGGDGIHGILPQLRANRPRRLTSISPPWRVAFHHPRKSASGMSAGAERGKRREDGRRPFGLIAPSPRPRQMFAVQGAQRVERSRCHFPTDADRALATIAWRPGEPQGLVLSVRANWLANLQAVERILPDCEVLLHSPSILLRIVAQGKRPYITLANQEHR
jgi:hypothetical protein